MPIDLHNDTIPMLELGHIQGDLAQNNGMLDLNKLQQGRFRAAFFSLFFDAQATTTPYETAQQLYQRFTQEIQQNASHIMHVRQYADYLQVQREDKIAAFLTLEGAEALAGKQENLNTFYEQGVRLMTLTWNYANEVAYPNGSERGLTPFGREVVEQMNALGMLIDVSHLSDAGFDEVAAMTQQPFMASHSNARAITDHPRNLDDVRIRALANAGGVMGLNFCSLFLRSDGQFATVADMVRHVQHIIQVGGEEVLALGSDFDGIPREVEIDDAGHIQLLSDGLLKSGISQRVIDKLLFANVERVLQDVL